MGRLLAIDYGSKRTGIAVTDEMQIIASGLTTVDSKTLIDFLKSYTPIQRVDERFTSKMAFQTMIDSGLNKKQRKNKALVDEISATLILQSYLHNK